MPDTLDRQSPAEYLTVMFGCMGPYEREIIVDIAQRLLQGQRDYGKFQALDNRDFGKETYHELLDGIVYSTILCKRLP